MGGNTTVSERLSLIATHNEFFFSSKLQLSLSDGIIIGGYPSVSSPNRLLSRTKRCVERAPSVYNTRLLRVTHVTSHGFWTLYMRF